MARRFASTWWTPISRDAGPRTTQLRVGRLTKAHGLKGAIKLELYTDDPARRFVPGAVFTLQVPTTSPWHGKTLELAELRWYNTHPVAFFKGVPDRTTAESLLKAILWIDQDLEQGTDEEDAWFDHQLVGLSVVRDGAVIGSIARVEHLPSQDLLHVETESGVVLVPFVKAIVPAVDIAAGSVTVTPPPGLFEELPDSDDDAGAPTDDPGMTSEGTGAPADGTGEPEATSTSPDDEAPSDDAEPTSGS